MSGFRPTAHPGQVESLVKEVRALRARVAELEARLAAPVPSQGTVGEAVGLRPLSVDEALFSARVRLSERNALRAHLTAARAHVEALVGCWDNEDNATTEDAMTAARAWLAEMGRKP